MSEVAIDTLARTIWGEARGQGVAGMIAVANVVMNRVAKPGWWGRDVPSVCLKKYQFSCWNQGDPNLKKLLTVTEADPQFDQAVAIATKAVAGELADTTNHATSYKESALPWPADWGRPVDPVAVIGQHSFYILT